MRRGSCSQKCNANGTYDIRLDNGEEHEGVANLSDVLIAMCVTITMNLYQACVHLKFVS